MVDNAHNDEAAPQRSLSTTEASLCYREAGRKKKEVRGARWEREKREERPLPYNVRLSGRICGSVVLA